jgi:dienelactone hydrolase
MVACGGENTAIGVTLLLSSGMRWRRRAAVLVLVAVVGLGAGYVAAHDYIRGAAFVVRAAGMQGIARTVSEWETRAVVEQDLTIPWRAGVLPARTYLPRGAAKRAFLLVPGVHASGVDEPRLIGFARDLASMGHPVVTVGPPDLARYTISPDVTDAIEDAAAWLSQQRDLAPDGRIGMMGISFAGGLSVVAAGRPALGDRVVAVLSLGGHGDLPRTLRYLCTGIDANNQHRPPHDYGVVIILLGVADRVVPAEQVAPLREAVLSFLEASKLDLIDKAASAAEFERARVLASALPEPSRTLMNYVNARDVAHLGPILLPHTTALGGAPALSPERSPAPSAPVYLLHGTGDNVIPAAETIALARNLTGRGTDAHALVTPLITHAEVDRAAGVSDAWALVGFWSDVLSR